MELCPISIIKEKNIESIINVENVQILKHVEMETYSKQE